MGGDRLEAILQIVVAGLNLKRRPRTGWVEKGIKNPESVADHSYSLALLAMLIADLRGLDAEKLIRMALLHDLAEAYVGDLTPRQKRRIGRENARKLEQSLLATLFRNLPNNLSERYLKLLEEMNNGETPEAKTLHELDKLEMALESLKLEQEYEINLSRFRREAIQTELGKNILKLLRTGKHARR